MSVHKGIQECVGGTQKCTIVCRRLTEVYKSVQECTRVCSTRLYNSV